MQDYKQLSEKSCGQVSPIYCLCLPEEGLCVHTLVHLINEHSLNIYSVSNLCWALKRAVNTAVILLSETLESVEETILIEGDLMVS